MRLINFTKNTIKKLNKINIKLSYNPFPIDFENYSHIQIKYNKPEYMY